MATIRYAGDRFVGNVGSPNSDATLTGVLDGAYYINTGNLTQYVKRPVGGWAQLAGGGGGGGTPGGDNTQVQFNNAGAFGGDADLTFTDGNRLNVNKLGISGNIYDSNNSIGEGGMVLTNEGTTGVNWKSIESVLSGVGGSGVANYVARWSDEDTITSGVIQDDGTAVGINQAADPDNALAIKSIANNTNPLQIAAHDGDSLLVFRQTAGDGRLSIKKDGGVETIRLDSDNVSYINGGNVGIGTNNPAFKLQVQTPAVPANNAYVVGFDVSRPNSASRGFTVGSNSAADTWTLGAHNADMRLGHTFGTDTGGQPTFYPDLTIKHSDQSAGNVGIGTTDPGGKLESYITNGGEKGLRLNSNFAGGNTVDFIPAIVGVSNAGFSIDLAGTNRLVINSGGNVGVGTNSPSHRLHVLGATTGGWNGLNLNVVISSSNTYANGHAGGIAFGGAYNSSETQTVLAGVWASRPNAGDGQYAGMVHIGGREHGTSNIAQVLTVTHANVGIGTNNPGQNLQIHQADSGVNYLEFTNTTATTGTLVGLNAAEEFILWHRHNSDMVFATNAVEKMRIENGGNVGIGTNAPAKLLTVRSTTSPIIGLYSAYADSNARNWSIGTNNAAYGDFTISASAANGGDPTAIKLSILKDGNVGIGTTGAVAHLHVSKSAGTTTVLTQVAANSTVGYEIKKTGSTTQHWKIVDGQTVNGTLEFYDATDSATRMAINGSGSVGIGTASPEAALTVAGPNYTHAIFRTNQSTASERAGGGFSSLGHATAASRYARLFLDADGANFSGTDYFTIEKFGNSGEVKFLQYSNANMSFWVNTSTQAMTIKNDGKVGIGTNNPGYPLTVANGITQARVDLTLQYLNDIDSLTNTDLGRVLFRAPYSGTGNNVGSITLRTGASAYRTDLRFKVKATGGSERQGIIIHGTNNGALVGIGQLTDPTFPFQVSASNLENGPAKRIALFFDETDAAAGTGAGIALGGYVGAGTDPGVSAINDFGVIQGIKENSTLGNYASAMRFLTRQNSANPAEQMRINSEGNVGIGTTTPIGKLHVYGGQVRILDSTASPSYGARLVVGRDTAQDIEFYVDDLNCKIVADQDSDTNGNHNFILDRSFAGNGDNNFQIQKGGSSQFLINTDGNVGINNTSPEHRLHVAGDAIISGYLYDSTNSTGVDGYVLTSKEDGPQWKMIEDVLSGVGGNGTANYIPKWIDSDTIGDSVIAESGGNIGIGTVTPEQLFEISATGDAAMQFQSTATQLFGGETIGAIKFKNNDSSGTDPHICGTIASIAETQYGRAGLAFSTGRTTEFAERMRIRWDGNVGIGTNAPLSKFNILGTQGNWRVDPDSVSNEIQVLSSNAANTGFRTFRLRTNETIFDTGGSERMRILSDGNVGIGSTTANARLKVVTSNTDVAIFQSTHATTTNFYISNSNATASNTANLYFGPANGVNGALIQAIAIEDFSTSANRTADLAFQTRKDGTFAEHMRIDSSGNVGIGTNNPTGKFQIGANYTIPGTSYGGDDIYIANTGSHSNYDPSVTNTDDFRALIAISDGTTTGPIKPGLILYNDDTTAGGFSPMLLFAKRETGVSPYKAATAAIYARSPLGTGNSNSWIDGELIFATAGAATQGIRQRMVINKEGLVGIGTDSPSTKLHVLGSGATISGGETTLNPSGTGATIASKILSLLNTYDTAYTSDALTAYNATTSFDISDKSSYTFFARPKNTNIFTSANEASGTANLQRYVNLNSSSTEPLLEWAFYQYDGTGTASSDFKTPDKLFRIIAREGSSNNTKFIIKGNGNVGVGTTNPTLPLHIYRASGNVYAKVQNASTSQAALQLQTATTDGNWVMYIPSNSSNLRFYRGADKVTLTADGSVGIGTPSPDGQLHLHSTASSAQRLIFSNSNENLNPQQRIEFWESTATSTSTDAHAAIEYVGDDTYESSNGTLLIKGYGASADLPIAGFNRNGNVYLGMSGNKKVGIGTNAPQGRLDINTEAAEATHVYINGEANQDKLLYFRHYANSEGAGANAYLGYIGSKGNDNLLSLGHLNTGGTDVPIMHLTEAGHVGIGTTDPDYILDVYETGSNIAIFRSTATNWARVIIRAGASGDAQLSFQESTTTKWTIGNDGGDSDKFKIVVGGGAFGTSPIVAIDTAGKVGVGSNAPAFNLDVTGTGHYTGLLNLNAGLYLARESDSIYGTYIKGGSHQFPASPAAYYTLGKYVMSTASYSYDTLTGHVVVGYGNPNTNNSFAKITFTVYFRDNNSLATGAPYVTWTYNVEGKFTFQSDPPFRVSKTQDVSGGAKTYELQFSVGAAYGTAHWKVCYSNVSTTNAVTIYDYAATIGTAISDGRVTRQGYQIYPGCVGVGTNSPDTLVHMRGSGPTLTLESTGNTDDPVIMLQRNNNTGLAARIKLDNSEGNVFFDNTYDHDNGDILFRTKGDTERVRIKGSGYVGIGTTAPDRKLDVRGNVLIKNTLADLMLEGNRTSNGVISRINFYNTAGSDVVATISADRDGANDAGAITFDTQPAGGSNTERMRIASSGAIQLNTYGSGTHTGTAEYKLSVDSSGNIIETAVGSGQVDGSGTANTIPRWTDADTIGDSIITVPSNTSVQMAGELTLNYASPILNIGKLNTSTGNAKLRFNSKNGTAANAFDIQFVKSATEDRLDFLAGGATTMASFLNGGQVGIGTTAPASLLHVGGAAATPHAAADDFVIAPAATDVGMTIRCNSNSGTGSIFFADTAANAQGLIRYNHNTDYMSFYSSGDFFFDTGSVGIGTVAPGKKLQISAGDGDHLLLQYSGSTGNSGAVRQIFQRSTGTEASPAGTNDGTIIGTTSYVAYAPSGSSYRNSAAIVVTRHGAANTVSAPAKIALATPGTADDTLVDRLTVLPGGSVGIGTDAPTEKLDVEGSLVLNVATGTGLGEEGIFFRRGFSDSNKYNISILAYAHDGAGNFSDGISINGYDGVSFCTGSNTRQERMRIVGGTGGTSGYVGIGTTAPDYLLHVQGTGPDLLKLRATTAGSANAPKIHFEHSSGGTQTADIVFDQSGQNKLKFTTYYQSATDGNLIQFAPADTVAMTIRGGTGASDGFVGIGTNNPDSKLHVLGDTLKLERTNNAPALKLYNNDASPADDAALGYLQFTGKDNNGTANMVYSEVRGGVQSNTNSAVSGYLSFLTTNNGTAVTEAMRIKADGSVGIATTTPAAKLDVRGNILRSGLTFSSWTSRSINTLTQAGATINYILIAAKTTINVRLSGRFKCVRSNGVSAVSIAHADVVFCTDNDANPQSGGIHSAASDIPTYGHANFEIVELTYNSTDCYALKISPSASWTAAFAQIEFEGISNNVIWTNVDSGNVSNIGAFGGSQAVFAYKHANVGIGTDSPAARLHITSDGSHDEGAEIVLRHANNNSTDVVSTLSFQNNGGQVAMIQGGTTSGNTNGYISLFTDNSGTSGERMRIISDGNVGIGTNAPSELLEVDGNIRLGDGTHRNIIGPTNATLGIYSNPNDSNEGIKFSTDGGSTIEMFLQDGGNVGIGTETPKEKLHVNNGSSSGDGVVYPLRLSAGAQASTAGDATGIKFIQRDQYNDYGGYIRLANTASNPGYLNPRLEFGVQNTNTNVFGSVSTKMVITGGGSVGIGEVAPGTILHLKQNDAVGPTISLTNNPKTAYINFWGATGGGTDRTNQFEINAVHTGYGITLASKDYVRFKTDGIGAADEAMRINSDGNVGIGTTQPGVALDVNGKLSIGSPNASYDLYNNGTTYLNGSVTIDALLSITGTAASQSIINSSTTDSAAADSYLNIFKTAGSGGGSRATLRVGYDATACFQISRIRNDANIYINSRQSGSAMVFQIQDTEKMNLTSSALTFVSGHQLRWGDSSTYITGSNSSDFLQFYPNGSVQLTLNSSGATIENDLIVDGSVGIGTTNPGSYKLLVNGNSYLDGTAYVDDNLTVDGYINFETKGDYLTFYGNANAHHSISSRNSSGTADDDIRINTYGGLFINLDSNGNDDSESHSSFQIGRHAGTGAVSASDLLLNLSGETGKLRLYKYGSGTHTGTAEYKLSVDSDGNVIETAIGAGAVDGSGTANYITRWTDTDTIGNSNIFDNGTIGIGTAANLNGKVTIMQQGNSAGDNHIFCQLSHSAVGHGAAIFLKTSTNTSNNRYGARIRAIRNDNNNAAADLAFSLENSGATGLAETVRFTSDGSVGIGTTGPTKKLHVNGGSDANLRLTSGSTRSGIFIDKPGTTSVMGSVLVLANETYSLGTANYYHVNMTQGGVTALLYQGSTKIATTSGGVTVTGTLTETSSIAIKENVETYTPSLDIINKIRPVKYNRKENKKKKEIGLIAEELAELFPELVEKDKNGNPSSVNYSRAVTVLLGGFKELYKEVQELKKRI